VIGAWNLPWVVLTDRLESGHQVHAITDANGEWLADVAQPALVPVFQYAPDLAEMVERLMGRLGLNDSDRLDAEALLLRARPR